jgi:hypothetical protein
MKNIENKIDFQKNDKVYFENRAKKDTSLPSSGSLRHFGSAEFNFGGAVTARRQDLSRIRHLCSALCRLSRLSADHLNSLRHRTESYVLDKIWTAPETSSTSLRLIANGPASDVVKYQYFEIR